jgi:hypothetical protein
LSCIIYLLGDGAEEKKKLSSSSSSSSTLLDCCCNTHQTFGGGGCCCGGGGVASRTDRSRFITVKCRIPTAAATAAAATSFHMGKSGEVLFILLLLLENNNRHTHTHTHKQKKCLLNTPFPYSIGILFRPRVHHRHSQQTHTSFQDDAEKLPTQQ